MQSDISYTPHTIGASATIAKCKYQLDAGFIRRRIPANIPSGIVSVNVIVMCRLCRQCAKRLPFIAIGNIVRPANNAGLSAGMRSIFPPVIFRQRFLILRVSMVWMSQIGPF